MTTTKKLTFESFLQDIHAKDYHGTDDDMPDAFDNWITELQVDDLMRYADLAIIQARKEAAIEAYDRAVAIMKDTFTPSTA